MFKKTDILFYKEASSLAFVIALSLSFIMIAARIMSFTKLLFASSNVLITLSFLFFYLLPIVLTTILPIAIFTSCTLIATRMSADREMDALFSFGMSIRQLLSAPILLGLISVLLMLLNSFYYEPYTREQFRFFKWFQARQMVESFVVNNIQEKTFISNFPLVDNNKFVFYVDSMSGANKFQNVFLTFEQDQQITHFLVAQNGEFIKTFDHGYPEFIFSLSKTSLYSNDSTMTQFERVDLSMLNAFGNKLKSVDEFQDTPDQNLLANTLRSICIAFSAFFFPILGMCLGLLNTHMKPFRVYAGIGIVIIIFYSSLSISSIFINRFSISPFIVYPFLPIIFFILTLFLARERNRMQ